MVGVGKNINERGKVESLLECYTVSGYQYNHYTTTSTTRKNSINSLCRSQALNNNLRMHILITNPYSLLQCVIFSSCLQKLNGENCLSLYHGKWPWKEIQLVTQHRSISFIWHHWLKAFMQQEKQVMASVSLLDTWLLNRFLKLKVEEQGSVFAVSAISSFTGYRRWKSCGVSLCYFYFLCGKI